MPASVRSAPPWPPYGGFDHNAQSFKVVTRLERKYAAFDGLNLTFETLEGLAKHNGPLDGPGPRRDVLRQAIAEAGLTDRLHLRRSPPPRRRRRPSPTTSPTTATISTTACARASRPR